MKVAADSAKDAAAGKDDEQSPRRGDSAGKRPAKRGGRPAKQVRLRGLLAYCSTQLMGTSGRLYTWDAGVDCAYFGSCSSHLPSKSERPCTL